MGMIVTNAENVDTARLCVDLANDHDIVYSAVGIHPEFALKSPFSDLEVIERLLSYDKVVAVGEVGLDYKWARSPEEKARQKQFFSRQIDMAKEHGLPVIVHSRRAHGPVVDMLLDSGVLADLHWYSGSISDAVRAVEGGIYFSFGPAVLYYESYRALVDIVPLRQILLETDAPVPFKGKTSKPWWVQKVAEFIADVKKTSTDVIVERTWQNARRFFSV